VDSDLRPVAGTGIFRFLEGIFPSGEGFFPAIQKNMGKNSQIAKFSLCIR
jgi:hypothetical protein